DDSGHDQNYLYELTLEPLWKETVGQRNSSATKLGTYVCGGSSWSDIKTKIFQKFKSKSVAIAQRDDEGKWESVQGFIDETYFDKIFAFRHGSHTKKIESEPKMNEWIASMRSTKLTLFIYKYGIELATKDHLTEFTTALVEPRNADRSGAADEETIRE
ncbi:unnamed protein product, partial [Aphanomyces euteiches]